MFGIIAALLSGALMSIQGVFNTEVTKQTGTWLTNSFVQCTGFLVCLIIWFFKERKKESANRNFDSRTEILSFRRGYRGIYYIYCNCRDVSVRTGKSSDAYCGGTAYCGIPY